MGKIFVKYSFALVLLLLVGSTLILHSCEEDGCMQSSLIKVNARFYERDSSQVITVSKFTLYGLGKNEEKETLYNSSAVSLFSFTLKQDTNTTAYVFDFPDYYNRDTVYIRHTNWDAVISLDCGCGTFSTIDSIYYTNHRIDTIIVRKQDIETSDEENIRIYL